MADKKCPRCGLWNAESALRCDCGYDFAKATVEESYSRREVSKSAARDAQNALITAIAGILLFGLFMEPVAIFLARKAKKSLAPGDDGYDNAKTAEIVAWVGLVVWIFLCLLQSIVIFRKLFSTWIESV